MMILVGTPVDSGWDSVIGLCEEVMVGVRERGLNWRGNFVAIPLGVSHGGGREACYPFSH